MSQKDDVDSLWEDQIAKPYLNDPLQLRVYTSRLLGREPALVLHGGGNTSLKMEIRDWFGEPESVLYVKGSGKDLACIDAEGFVPLKLEVLQRMAMLESLTDRQTLDIQKTAMMRANAPEPSVEAILHAIIPFKYVDHTHADAVLTITNTVRGEELIRNIYGDRVLIVPYVKPGFALAKKIHQITKNLDWKTLDGLILMHHGIFTFHDDARECYEKMIYLVSEAEAYLLLEGAWDSIATAPARENLVHLARIRCAVSKAKGSAMLAMQDNSPEACGFASLPDIETIATQGPLTPDHVIHTKRIPLIVEEKPEDDVLHFVEAHEAYFARHDDGSHRCLSPEPRWAIWPDHGIISFGCDIDAVRTTADIASHTILAIQRGVALGGWRTLQEKDVFAVEYWDLEQAKLRQKQNFRELTGKIAIVTGAASGIGKECMRALLAYGAVVAAVDINPAIQQEIQQSGTLGIACDLRREEALRDMVQKVIRHFGGLDILISNAGIFPESQTIEKMDADLWNRSLEVNLTSHQRLIQFCLPYLKWGLDPSVVIIASKNVIAPGPGASAYSVAKAGLTQLARVAALEYGASGIRVNVIHPNAVFDTGLWTEELLKKRAQYNQMSLEEYKTNNILGVEVTSKDVAALACAMAGSVFAKTTGAQVPVDGGNARVI